MLSSPTSSSSSPLPANQASPQPPSKPRRSSGRRKKYGFIRRFKAPTVFWTAATLGVLAAALTYVRGTSFVVGSALVCVFIGYAVFVNDKRGFSTKGKDRRMRNNFTTLEGLVLGALVLVNITVAAWVFIR